MFKGSTSDAIIASNLKGLFSLDLLERQGASPEAQDLAKCLMQSEPDARISAKDSLLHPWFVKHESAIDEDMEEEAKEHERQVACDRPPFTTYSSSQIAQRDSRSLSFIESVG